MHIGTLLVVLFYFGIRVNTQVITKNNKSCSAITLSTEFGISVTHLLKKPATGMNLKICQSKLTCCSQQMENEIYNRSSRLLKDALHLGMNTTQHFLATQTTTFDDYFKKLFIQAQAKWHGMLFTTYKQTYQENRYVFQKFFTSLEDYYGKGNVNITSSTESFFNILLKKVLVLLNPSLNGTQGFLDCISKKMDIIFKPFAQSRRRLTSQLKMALHISRRFVEGLKVATNVASSLTKQLSTTNCLESFTKIRHCSICRGIPNAMVCKDSCQNVLQSSCFSYIKAIDIQWNEYVDQLYKMSIAMEGPYNIDAVAGKLSFDISSAIMQLQTNLNVILKKANMVCAVNSGKTKRSVDSTDSDLYLEGDRRRKRASSDLPRHWAMQSRSSSKSVETLDSLTKDFRKQVNGMKDVWSTLPDKICNDRGFVSSDSTASCWNGTGLQSNSSNVPVLKSMNNNVNAVRDVQTQLSLLKISMEKIKVILQGIDFRDGSDDDDSLTGARGSWSGSGSGDSSNTKTTTDTTGTPSLLPDLSSIIPTVESGDGENEDSGSGSGSGYRKNDIVEFSTKATKNNNSVEHVTSPTGSDHSSHSNDVVIRILNTDRTVNNSGWKTSFGASSSVTHICLFLSALLLNIF